MGSRLSIPLVNIVWLTTPKLDKCFSSFMMVNTKLTLIIPLSQSSLLIVQPLIS